MMKRSVILMSLIYNNNIKFLIKCINKHKFAKYYIDGLQTGPEKVI